MNQINLHSLTIKQKLSILNSAILIVLTIVLVLAGTVVINRILYQLNEKLMLLELDNKISMLRTTHETLKSSGLDGMAEYVQNAQKEAFATFSGYVFGKKGFLLIIGNGEKLSGPDFKGNTSQILAIISKQTSGTLKFTDEGTEYFAVVRPFEPWKWSLVLAIPLGELSEQLYLYLRSVGIIAILVLITSFFLFTAFSNRLIVKPISEIGSRLAAIAEGGGDLRTRLNIQSEDEIGRLALSFNRFVDKLQSVVKNIADSTKTLSSSSVKLSSTSGEIDKNSGTMRTESANVASASGKVSNEINTISSASREMSTAINGVAAAIEQMSTSLNEIASSCQKESIMTDQATRQAEAIRNQMSHLRECAQDINKIMTVIDQIASQTNLLALNATIEAASAGESGKGFAVVAGEVKDLARQTATATSEIEGKVIAVQESVQAALKSIEVIASIISDINHASQSIAASVEEQSAAVNEVAKNIGHANSTAGGIAEGVSRSAEAIGNVAGGIRQVNLSVEQTAKGVSDLNNYAMNLSKMSTDLQNIVSLFKI